MNGERNGRGKEYNYQGMLIYEGEFLYDSYLKGRFYINEKLEYEGEYLFDKKWNGKGYDEQGNIIYELINGNGKVKEYDIYYNKVYYEGEYLNGRSNGKGKEYYKDGSLRFEGDYLNGKRIGKEYEKDGLIFEGEYLNGKKWNGKGKEYNGDMFEYEIVEYLNGKKKVIEKK